MKRGIEIPPASRGFTLVELLVSIAIFTFITTVAIFNNAQFNGSVLLTNLAYEIGLSIRQAQFYGISVRQNAALSFNSGYGIDFNTASPSSYVLFEDKTGGTAHVKDAGDVDIQTFTIGKGNRISKICLNGVTPCSAAIVDVTFLRPNPDAYIRSAGTSYGKAEICLQSPQGLKRKVTVESTGQISAGADDTGVCN
ncbi:prepilin-type N-terminal cleavage/methylation domain-containing protein [Candidatus Parcubacteria bacterium]|nr:prepilin-type N-terminal cleavage/methylation domain-containing protein [Candidatus Parcubacteria bacterium]